MSIDPSLDLVFQNALRFHKSGRFAEAEALYRQVIEQNPKHAQALHSFGVLASQCRRLDLGEDLIRKAIVLLPDYPQARVNLGNILKEQGRLDEAISAYSQAIALKSDLPEAYLNLGGAYSGRGQLDLAITAFRQAIALRPNYFEAYSNLGVTLVVLERFDEAIAAHRQAVALSPGRAESHVNLGLALIYKEQFEEGISALRQAMALDPNNQLALSNLGNALLLQEQRDEATAARSQSTSKSEASKTPVIWLECTSAILAELCRRGLIYTGLRNSQNGIDRRLLGILRLPPQDRQRAFQVWMDTAREEAAACGAAPAIWHPWRRHAEIQALGFSGPILRAAHVDEARSKLLALRASFLDAAGNPRVWVSHSGKFGDLIYGLPVLRAMGGGHIFLTPNPYWDMVIEPRHAAMITPLLRAQPYITGVEFVTQRPRHAINLDQFRLHWNEGRNITEYHLSAFGQALSAADAAWLSVPDVRRAAKVIFNRTARSHNPRFPWRRIVEKYGRHAAFVGLPEEYQMFCAQFGAVDYCPTRDFLELAQVIAGCQLYVGNQSAGLAVAEGLKVNILYEIMPQYPDCVFEGAHAVAGWDENVALRDLL